MAEASGDTEQAAHNPAGEVVELCRELIRIDTSNYGDDSGPGERKAAEYVAALLDEVGIESTLIEGSPGRTSVVAQWGGTRGRRSAAARPPRRRTRRRGGLAGRSVLRRDPGRLRLGPRRGRHEGLRRDAAQHRPRPPADRPGPVAADHAVLHRRRGGRRPPGRAGDRRGPPRAARGLHRGGRRGRRLQRHRARPPDLPDRGRREGHGLDAAHGPGSRRARLDDQPRERRDVARRPRWRGSAPTSGRCG